MFNDIEAIPSIVPSFGRMTVEPDTHSTRITAMQPFDTQFWEKVSGPTCHDGLLHETWCFIECAGGTCQTLWCEDRIVGSC